MYLKIAMINVTFTRTKRTQTCLRERYRIMEKRMANREEIIIFPSSVKWAWFIIGALHDPCLCIFAFGQAMRWNNCLWSHKRIDIIMHPHPSDYNIYLWHHNAPNFGLIVKHAANSCSEAVEWSSHSARLVAGVPLFLFKGSTFSWGFGGEL